MRWLLQVRSPTLFEARWYLSAKFRVLFSFDPFREPLRLPNRCRWSVIPLGGLVRIISCAQYVQKDAIDRSHNAQTH